MKAHQHGQPKRLTLQEYLNSYNLRLKLKSMSKEKKTDQPENKKAAKIPSITKLTRTEMVETLKLTIRQLISDDQQFIKVVRMIDRLTQIYQMEIEESRRDKGILESIIKENEALGVSMLGTQRGVDPGLRRSKLCTTNINQRQTLRKNSINQLSAGQNSQNRLLTGNKTIEVESKFKTKLDQSKYVYNNIHQTQNGSKEQVPCINILQIQRKDSKQEQQTSQTLHLNINPITIESPTKKSVKWDHEMAIYSKYGEGESPMDHYYIETPSTLQKRSEQKLPGEKKQKPIQQNCSDMLLQRFQSFIKRKQSQDAPQKKL